MKDFEGFIEYLKSNGVYTFKNYCNCGGYASDMNGRNKEHPHMSWCAQYGEWEQYWREYELRH